MTLDFQFDESTHTYRIGGAVVPGCTRVVGMLNKAVYSRVQSDLMERKGKEGRAVHLATHFYDEEALDWKTVDEQIKPRVDAWVDFRQRTGFIPTKIEFQCVAEVNGMKYGMQIDREGPIRKMDSIVEIKITSEIGPWHGVQTAGYALGLPMGPIMNPLARFTRRRRYVVQLLLTGKAKIKEFTDPQDADVFMWLLGVKKWMKNNGLEEMEG